MNTALKVFSVLNRSLLFLFMCIFAYIVCTKGAILAFILFVLFTLFLAIYLCEIHSNKPVGVVPLDIVVIVLMVGVFMDREGYNLLGWIGLSFAIADIFFIMLLNYKKYKEGRLLIED